MLPEGGEAQKDVVSEPDTTTQPESKPEPEAEQTSSQSENPEQISPSSENPEQVSPSSESPEQASPSLENPEQTSSAQPELSVNSEPVKKLAKEQGLSLEAALAVTQGLTTLERALHNLKSRKELNALVQEHKLPHSLAGQVLKKQLTLEDAITRAHVLEHRRLYQERCSFKKALNAGEPLILALHGKRIVTAEIVENLKYDLKIRVEGKEEVIPKHEVKYAYRPEYRKYVRKAFKVEKELETNPRGPITKVVQRFKVKDDTLQKIIDLKSHLAVVLLEGERFSAELKYYSRYEIVLGMKGEAEISILRHALHHAAPVPLEEVLAAERYAKKMQKKAAKGKKKKRRH